MSIIEIKNLTKDYGDNRGIFDINLTIEKGEIIGFVGTNGAGKTTTIRHLMGFLKPDKGSSTINNKDCWNNSSEVKNYIGYVPGEINFPNAKTGTDFLNSQADLLGLKDMTYRNKIIKMLQLDPTANLKRMSKGMKQKTALVAAFMNDPDILILDEPTTGLDPLMRSAFVELILEEKKKGKTILMSSHMFEEVEDTCDKVALIKNGKIIAVKDTFEIKHNNEKFYKIEFNTNQDYLSFKNENFVISTEKPEQNQITIQIQDDNINCLTKTLTKYDIKFFKENKYTLEQYFKNLV